MAGARPLPQAQRRRRWPRVALLATAATALSATVWTFCHAPPSARRSPVALRAEGPAAASVRKYFEAWNERDMDAACEQFSEDCSYEDTQYAGAFTGKEALETHLFKVADALPPTFRFCIDEIADAGNVVGVQWHVENDGQPLPFTRGCSMYKADPETGKLRSGFDVPEPAPFKPGSSSLAVLSVVGKLLAEPLRWLPLVAWVLYVTIVFFSNGILPGKDATQLDPATWEEVINLSLNFWLISPLLQLPFAPVVHPCLEGLFNLVLVWAGAFAGFLSDGRPGRASGTMVPTVLGMQFLTNAVLLPYLVTRSPEPELAGGERVCLEDLDETEASVSESRLLGPVLAVVGAGSLAWAALARPEYGDLSTRLASFGELLSNDRLGSSFVVDVCLFALFQGWLVDDDLRRRGAGPEDHGALRLVAKFVPFFGLCAYLLLRPSFPSRADAGSSPGAAA